MGLSFGVRLSILVAVRQRLQVWLVRKPNWGGLESIVLFLNGCWKFTSACENS